MAFTVNPDSFRFPAEFAGGVQGKRVLISGAGKDGGLGQSFALAAGLNGAAAVAVHFHSSYEDAIDIVDYLRGEGVNAFGVQADVTNLGDLWATRSYVMERMGGAPNLVICNSGLTEKGYTFGRAPREVEGEPAAKRRARARQAFISNLTETQAVLDTKIDGFIGMSHLWAGEAVYANEPLQIVYISSRQAIDPGVSVPGYSVANWAVLQLPKVLAVNLGRSASLVSAYSVLYPFVRTGMTGEYAENPKVFGRWQPRMLETNEAAQAFMQVLARPAEETNGGMFEVLVDAVEGDEGAVKVAWREVKFNVEEAPTSWSEEHALIYK
jgi:NAD(P)-dependent dehydrogenase (short-subunit alcohol dehydrogenase family)